LLTSLAGSPLMAVASGGSKAKTKTMLPVIEEFMTAHHLPAITVVADAGMISEANQEDIEAAGLLFILGVRIPCGRPVSPRAPGQDIPDGTVRGIDEQIAKDEQAVAGATAVKRNRRS
jgi:hypothetical protein